MARQNKISVKRLSDYIIQGGLRLLGRDIIDVSLRCRDTRQFVLYFDRDFNSEEHITGEIIIKAAYI
jgi:hypothetical protein